MKRLTAKDLPAFRAKMLKTQKGIDPITSLPVVGPCLDHDHVTGIIRGVLGRACNSFEGKVSNAHRRTGLANQGADLSTCLRGMADYLEWKSLAILHPSHKTEDEKRVRRNLRAKKTRAKRKTK